MNTPPEHPEMFVEVFAFISTELSPYDWCHAKKGVFNYQSVLVVHKVRALIFLLKQILKIDCFNRMQIHTPVPQ